jgi:hypothetical protein
MKRDSFEKLYNTLELQLYAPNEVMAKRSSGSSVSKKTKLYCSLRWLAGGSYLYIYLAFGVSRSSFFQLVLRVVLYGLWLMPSILHFKLAFQEAEISWGRLPTALPALLVGNYGVVFLQLIDGFARPENPINLRLEMLWHIEIVMVAGGLLSWLGGMLIAVITFFLACILAQLMTALHGISVRPVKWWSILIGLHTSVLLVMTLLFAQITFWLHILDLVLVLARMPLTSTYLPCATTFVLTKVMYLLGKDFVQI